MGAFNLVALDKEFQVLSLLRFTNLQWRRKYYESGSFSLQIPVEQYSPEIKYVYTKDRPEIGKVTQVNYVEHNHYKNVQLSGYFLEKELDRHVVYQKGDTNIINAPTWAERAGVAEDVAFDFFESFRLVVTSERSSDLGIAGGVSLGRGKEAVHTRNGELLGDKIHWILEPSGMSYRIKYDFITNTKVFEVWSGLDRTDSNLEGNNPIVFSTRFGNIKNPNILLSETEHKNASVIVNERYENDVSLFVVRAVFDSSEEETVFLPSMSIANKNDYSDEAFDAVLTSEAINQISQYPKVINVEFDALSGSYEYMVDFDLGDLCSVEIPEMDLSLQSRLIGCYEVMKSGIWTLTMEFGTPIILER